MFVKDKGSYNYSDVDGIVGGGYINKLHIYLDVLICSIT